MAERSYEEERAAFFMRWRLAGHVPVEPHNAPTLAGLSWIIRCRRCRLITWHRAQPPAGCGTEVKY